MNQERIDNHAEGVTVSQQDKKFKFESPIPGVHIYETGLDSKEFFNKIGSDEFWDKDAGPGDTKWVREDYLDAETGKQSESCWLDYSKDIDDALGEIINSYVYHWNLDVRSRESLRITKFSGSGDFFGMHSDDSFATPRTTSIVYYATDDYEGGELEFIHFGVKIKPKAGQLFIFPSGFSYEHKVAPVTGGNEPRITVVSFFNQMTFTERENRRTYLDPESHYNPEFRNPLNQRLNATEWPRY